MKHRKLYWDKACKRDRAKVYDIPVEKRQMYINQSNMVWSIKRSWRNLRKAVKLTWGFCEN